MLCVCVYIYIYIHIFLSLSLSVHMYMYTLCDICIVYIYTVYIYIYKCYIILYLHGTSYRLQIFPAIAEVRDEPGCLATVRGGMMYLKVGDPSQWPF